MFDNPRYLTRGVNTKISLFLQTLLWDMIDEMQIKKDYLDHSQKSGQRNEKNK